MSDASQSKAPKATLMDLPDNLLIQISQHFKPFAWLRFSSLSNQWRRIVVDKAAESEDKAKILFYAVKNNLGGLIKGLSDAGIQEELLNATLESQGNEFAAQLYGTNYKEADCKYLTPLGMACQEGHLQASRMLLEAGAAVDIFFDQARSPIQLAVKNDQADIVEMLLPEADVHKHNSSLLRIAIPSYNTDGGSTQMLRIIKALLAAGVELDDGFMPTPLAQAVKYCPPQVVEMLLKAGAKVYTTDDGAERPEGVRPRHCILHSLGERFGVRKSPEEALAVAKMLVERGKADPLAKDDTGNTVLHVLSRFTSAKDLIPYFVGLGPRRSTRLGINSQNNNGSTPLMFSVNNKKAVLPVAAVLLESGADVNLANNKGATPLHASVYNSHTAASKLLIQQGADVNAKTTAGVTPLMYVAQKVSSLPMIKMLVDSGADVKAVAADKATALYYAVRAGGSSVLDLTQKLAVVRYLLDNGADPLSMTKPRDKKGNLMTEYDEDGSGYEDYDEYDERPVDKSASHLQIALDEATKKEALMVAGLMITYMPEARQAAARSLLQERLRKIDFYDKVCTP